MVRRRKYARRAGIASRGMGRRCGRFCSRVRHRGVPDCERAPDRCNVLNARWMAVLWTFRAPSLGRRVHHELLRNVLLDLTPIIAVTVFHQRGYVERYSRFRV